MCDHLSQLCPPEILHIILNHIIDSPKQYAICVIVCDYWRIVCERYFGSKYKWSTISKINLNMPIQPKIPIKTFTLNKVIRKPRNVKEKPINISDKKLSFTLNYLYIDTDNIDYVFNKIDYFSNISDYESDYFSNNTSDYDSDHRLPCGCESHRYCDCREFYDY